jgi:hypothetical protein
MRQQRVENGLKRFENALILKLKRVKNMVN